MAVQVFENVEWTSVLAGIDAADNPTGIVQWVTNDLNLVFQRKVVAFSAFAYSVDAVTGQFRLFPYVDIRFNVTEPLNTSSQFTFASSVPPGGFFLNFTNQIAVRGNTRVNILPMPIKIVNFAINCHDAAAINRDAFAHVVMFWETKKRTKFVGEE